MLAFLFPVGSVVRNLSSGRLGAVNNRWATPDDAQASIDGGTVGVTCDGRWEEWDAENVQLVVACVGEAQARALAADLAREAFNTQPAPSPAEPTEYDRRTNYGAF